MSELSARVSMAIFVEFLIHFIFFTLVVWLMWPSPILWTLSYGALLAIIALFLEWFLGPFLVSSLFEPRWIERSDDPVLWSMVHEEAAKSGVRVRKIGILESDAPNALAYAFLTGKPHIIFTKGMLIEMTYPEVRAVTCYLLGCARSGGLSLTTMLSGLMTIHHGIADGYITSRLKGGRPGYGNIAVAGFGYLLFALTYPQAVMVSKAMSIFGDEFSITRSEDPSKFLSALIKSTIGCAGWPKDQIRARLSSLKGLMFQDPSLSIRDAQAVKDTATGLGIELNRLLDKRLVRLPDAEQATLHAFERFQAHVDPVGRLDQAIYFGKQVQAPIKMGLNWIE
jgi:Zn-dependent protease with chaperone function